MDMLKYHNDLEDDNGGVEVLSLRFGPRYYFLLRNGNVLMGNSKTGVHGVHVANKLNDTILFTPNMPEGSVMGELLQFNDYINMRASE